MTAALRKPMTLDEFLAWDETQEDRWEFDGFGPVAMTGGTRAHAAAVTVNLIVALGNRLHGGRWRVYNDGLQLRPKDRVRYPDAFVACADIPNAARTAPEPVAVSEVLSPSTASTDFLAKNEEYRSIPSVRRYVILAPDPVSATVFEWRGGEWVGTQHTDPGTVLPMPEIGTELPLAGLYAGVLGNVPT